MAVGGHTVNGPEPFSDGHKKTTWGRSQTSFEKIRLVVSEEMR